VVLTSGEEKPCDLIIAATGYKPIRSFIPKDVQQLKEKDGFWLYRQMVHPDHPRLVFLNSEVTTFTNITTPSIQARWLVELLAGHHKLPGKQEMQAEIKKMQDWKRLTMPNAGPARAYMMQTHQIHYYDQLLKDMGASIRRKTGNIFMRAVKEIFDPYRPRDFCSILTGEFKYCKEELATSTQGAFAKEGLVFVLGVCALYVVGQVFRDGLKSQCAQFKDSLDLIGPFFQRRIESAVCKVQVLTVMAVSVTRSMAFTGVQSGTPATQCPW